MRSSGSRRKAARALLPGLVVLVTLTGCARPEFDGEAAHRLIEEQCSLGPRFPGSPGHAKMRDWLIAEVSRWTDAVSVQTFETVGPSGGIELTNVIASFGVSERQRVLLGAHWDTRAVAECDPDPTNREMPILGANDGASGVAVLLELARLMSEREPSVGVDLVFFDGEDGGDEGGLGKWCIGSTYYATHLGDYCPEYAVVIDMIGDCELSIPIEPNCWAACPLEVDRVWSAARRVEAASFTRLAGVSLYDDHVPLIRAGIPSVLVIDFDYPYWHTLADTPDKCCPASLAEVGRVLVELIY